MSNIMRDIIDISSKRTLREKLQDIFGLLCLLTAPVTFVIWLGAWFGGGR